MKANKSIIVKKVKKVHGGGHHGGAWKVAYADFVTAMMAFFLLMWLLNMTSDEKRARLSSYFKYFSIYESGGTSWMDKSSEIFGESGENKQKVFTARQTDTDKNADANDYKLQQEVNGLKDDLQEKLGDMKDQVLIDVVDEGIRIQMTDKEGSLMFERGNNKLTPKAKQILKVISEDIKNHPNKIIIEGHTDSLSYAGSQYSNWELSTERASSARKELEATGLDPKRITRVAGYADTDPLIKDNPQDPRNRRISITLSGPQNSGSKKANLKAIEVKSNEKQLREASKELISILDNGIPAKKEDRAIIDIVKGIYNKNSNNIIKRDEWPALRPIKKNSPVLNEEDKNHVIKKEYYSLIEGAPSVSEKEEIDTADKINNKKEENKPFIKQYEWPAFRPIKKTATEMNAEDKASVNKKNDYDSIIKEGQSTLKNGSKKSTDKDQSKRDERKSKEPPVTKIEGKRPAVIKELSEPIIIKEKLFSITPNGK